MTAKGAFVAYLPSLMLAGFGMTLMYIAWVVGAISPPTCPMGPVCALPPDQTGALSIRLFFASVLVLSVSAATALVTYWWRARAATVITSSALARS